jgi:hypothetical protein
MSKTISTVKGVDAARHPTGTGRPVTKSCGEGLYLQIANGGTKSWLFKYRLNGKDREMGLGTNGDNPPALSLSGARDAARSAKAKVKSGIDPKEHRDSQRNAAAEKK